MMLEKRRRGRMKLVGAVLMLAVAVRGEAPKEAVIQTKFGPIFVLAIQVAADIPDKPCGFAARVLNPTGVRWSGASLNITLTSAGRTATISLIDFDYLGVPSQDIRGGCSHPVDRVDGLSIELSGGTPEPEDVARVKSVPRLSLAQWKILGEKQADCHRVYLETINRPIAVLTLQQISDEKRCVASRLYR